MQLENQRLMASAAMRKLGFNWYTHPDLPDCNREGGFQRIQKSNQERIALFAHGQFGVGFLSTLLDIPYPLCVSHLEMCHSAVTVIEFREGEDVLAMPQILTLSNDSHLYRDGLPTKYNNRLYF